MMEFVVDRVSEDSFYENLLIGLPKLLEYLPNISDLHLERYPPAQHNLINGWEQKFGVLLPEDLRCFYASTNGLLYTYNFSYINEKDTEDNILVCRIDINNLNNLVQIYDYEVKEHSGANVDGDCYELKLGQDSKVFELVNMNNIGRVLLVYINPRYLPSIWFHNSSMQFYFLADDFTTYLRMCIYHIGIPLWQFAYTSEGIPEWSEMVFRLLVPTNLPLNIKIEDMKKESNNKTDFKFPEFSINKIDSNIFKFTKPLTNISRTEIVQQSENVNQSKKKHAKMRIAQKLIKKCVNNIK